MLETGREIGEPEKADGEVTSVWKFEEHSHTAAFCQMSKIPKQSKSPLF